MKHFWLLGLIFFISTQALARSVEVCPVLPDSANLEWDYHQGPDFDVCYAHAPGSDDLAFGIYLGSAPSFHPERASRIGKGKVAGRRVTWHHQEQSDAAPLFSRQTLLTLDRKWGYVAHIWVAADSEEQLAERLAVLEGIVFTTP